MNATVVERLSSMERIGKLVEEIRTSAGARDTSRSAFGFEPGKIPAMMAQVIGNRH